MIIFKDHVIGQIPNSLIEECMRPILVGIAQAIALKKTLWTPTTNMNFFAKSMRAIIKFANLIVVPSRKILDLDKVPQVRKNLEKYI